MMTKTGSLSTGEADNAFSPSLLRQQGWQVISMQKEWLIIFPQG
jgi:hypothetical protein